SIEKGRTTTRVLFAISAAAVFFYMIVTFMLKKDKPKASKAKESKETAPASTPAAAPVPTPAPSSVPAQQSQAYGPEPAPAGYQAEPQVYGPEPVPAGYQQPQAYGPEPAPSYEMNQIQEMQLGQID